MVEHSVDDDPCDADKHPDGPDPTCKPTVFLEVGFVGASHDEDDEGYVDCRKDGVWDKYAEIDRPRPVVVRIGYGPHVEMIDQVGSEKQDTAD